MDVKVNDGEWTGLSEQDRAKIQSIIAANFHGTNVVGDKGAQPSADAIASKTLSFNWKNPICTAACGIAEAAAVAACAALSGPAIPICIAAAHGAGEFCRSRC